MQRPSFSIYDASAGSGKTYALVREYLKIILTASQNDAYRNILAITFTNKAVHEMKGRIIDHLSEFAKADPNQKATDLLEVLRDETGLSIEKIKSKSRQIIKHIIHNYAAFDISTIDKFTHKVIRAFARDLNLPLSFEVSLDTEQLLTEAVDAIIAEAGSDETLTKLLIDFTMEKTDDDKSWDISREIMETGRLASNENNRNEILHFRGKSIEEFIAIKKKLLEACSNLETEFCKFGSESLRILKSAGIDLKSFSAGHFPKHLESIASNQFKPANKRYYEVADVAINKTARDGDQISSVLPEIIALLAEAYKNYEKQNFYRAFLKNITPLSLLNTISTKLENIQKEQNILSISEFNAIIYDQIQNQPAPFIYERLGEKYRHYFIDEFQDTSEMQWQNLIPLINNAVSGQSDSGDKGTVMIVGDPKQSIYRWRGGKAEQFIALATDQNPFNCEKSPFSLAVNYRSYSQVIDFNNEFFKMLSQKFDNEDYKDLYENHSFQECTDKKGGYVNICLVPKTDKNQDDEDSPDKTQLHLQATLRTINDVLDKGFRMQDIAILTRKRKNGVAVAQFLTEMGIPVLSSETLLIENSTEVRFVIHVLRYLKNNQDNESKARLLQYFAANRQNEMPVHDFIQYGMRLQAENDFENWISEQNQGSEFVFNAIRKKSLYETVEMIIAILIKPSGSNAYLQYFLDIVLERDIRNQLGISDFLIFWEDNKSKFSIPSPEDRNAVKILTIHKSKGLEFPVVIMPFAEEDYSRKFRDKLWLDADDTEIDLSKVLVDNTKAVENFSTEAALVFNSKKQEELLDNINILYVALTRAEEQLYIISGMNLTAKGEICENNMSTFFIDYLELKGVFETSKFEYEFGSPSKLSPEEKILEESPKFPVVLSTLDPKNIRIAQRESLMWGTVQQEAIEYGNVVHEILSYIMVESDIQDAIQKALETGLISVNQLEEVQGTISQIVSHPELSLYFDTDVKVLNERTIIRKTATPIKPDRVVVNSSNEVYILDYKTGLHNPKYVEQLQTYEDAIVEMGYKVIKRSLVYISKNVNVVNL